MTWVGGQDFGTVYIGTFGYNRTGALFRLDGQGAPVNAGNYIVHQYETLLQIGKCSRGGFGFLLIRDTEFGAINNQIDGFYSPLPP